MMTWSCDQDTFGHQTCDDLDDLTQMILPLNAECCDEPDEDCEGGVPSTVSNHEFTSTPHAPVDLLSEILMDITCLSALLSVATASSVPRGLVPNMLRVPTVQRWVCGGAFAPSPSFHSASSQLSLFASSLLLRDIKFIHSPSFCRSSCRFKRPANPYSIRR